MTKEVELKFPFKFYCAYGSALIYTAVACDNDRIKVVWNDGKNNVSYLKSKVNELINDGYWIIVEDTSNKPSFTKSDLKDGMICTTRNGNVYTVQGDRMYRDGGMYISIEDVKDDLTVTGGGLLDIMKVEQPVVVFDRKDSKQKNIQQELKFAKAKRERLDKHIVVLEGKLK